MGDKEGEDTRKRSRLRRQREKKAFRSVRETLKRGINRDSRSSPPCIYSPKLPLSVLCSVVASLFPSIHFPAIYARMCINLLFLWVAGKGEEMVGMLEVFSKGNVCMVVHI